MKAWRMYGFGDLRLDEIPVPEVKPGWVLLKVRVLQPSITEVEQLHGKAFGGARDFLTVIKEQGPQQFFGHEFCGEVVEVGKDIASLKVGDRVFHYRGVPCHQCTYCRAGYEEYCHTVVWVGKEFPGCLAEYIALPATAVTAVPDSISDNEAAAMQPMESSVGIVTNAGIQMGDSVVVLGQGVMGLNAMQICRASGAGKVIGVDVRQAPLELARKLGADFTIDASKEDAVEAVKKATRGFGADIVFECAGGSPEAGLAGTRTLTQAFNIVRDGGKIVQVAHLAKETTVPAVTIANRGLHYLGRWHCTTKLIDCAISLVATKRVQLAPYITHVLEGLDKVPQAFEITGNKSKYGAINPAQVRVTK